MDNENTPNLVSAREFERQVQALEEVSIVLHTPTQTMVPSYNYTRQSAGNNSLTNWLNTRIRPCLEREGEDEENIQFSIISPDYSLETPNGRTKMETLRSRYER